jgi:hypothetical protein
LWVLWQTRVASIVVTLGQSRFFRITPSSSYLPTSRLMSSRDSRIRASAASSLSSVLIKLAQPVVITGTTETNVAPNVNPVTRSSDPLRVGLFLWENGQMDNSLYSYKSKNSVLSLWSSNSFMSIGARGSAFSIGSVGSFGSILSIGSFLSILALMSSLTFIGVMAHKDVSNSSNKRARKGSRTFARKR